jgi:glycosyltransferase involved in cell wall biosynthesis
MAEKVSIIVIAHNEAGYLRPCIDSLLSQAYEDFELIMVDSCSTDDTLAIMKEAAVVSGKIRYFSIPQKGYSVARNFGVRQAGSKYIFFLDADCVAQEHWLERGMSALDEEGVAGVSGLTYYVARTYKPSVRDYVVHNKNGDVYPTCNIAFKKALLDESGGFRLRYNEGLEDWDLVLRLKKRGRVVFADKMVVFHQKKPRLLNFDPDRFHRIRNLVYLIEDHYGDKDLPRSYIFFRIVLLFKLLILICPPLLVIYYIFARRVNPLRDMKYIFMDYFDCVMIRIVIWKTAFQEKFLVI